jgi:hypothetical protein
MEMANKVYFRDTINLTQALLSKLEAETGVGERIIIAARVLRVQGELTLKERELSIVADQFEGHSGAIWVIVPNESTTPAPLPKNGKNGKTVLITSRSITGANIASLGGNGQPGADGADGAEGSDYQPANGPGQPFHPGTPGEDGQDGWRGGNGGNGGLILVNVVGGVPAGVPLNLLSIGGAGGAGGKGGKGGTGGLKNSAGDHWPNGEDGTDANPGTYGIAIDSPPLNAEIENYWLEAMAVPGIFLGNEGEQPNEQNTATWAKHRLKMAEYFFRQYIPKTASAFYGPLARTEVEAVLAMAPVGSATAKHAQLLDNFLKNNISPVGLQRNIEPRLSVPYYSDDYEFARERADMVVDRALLFGMTAINVGKIRSLAEGQCQQLSNPDTRKALEASLCAAETEQQSANASEVEAKATVDKLSAMITARSNYLESQDESSLLDVLGGPVAAAALGVGFAFLVGGPPGAAAALPAAANYVLGSKEFQSYAGSLIDELDLPLQEIEKGLTTLQTVSQWSGGNQAEVLKDVKMSFQKFRSDLDQARGKSDPILLDLVQQQAAAVHQHFLAELGVTQAGFTVEAAQAQLDALDTNIAFWEGILENFDTTNKFLRRYTVRLIEQARGPFDTLLRLQFKMARALELYTLDVSATPDLLKADYGFAHPDVERDFLEASGNTSMLVEYLASIATLSTDLPGDQYALLFAEYTEPSVGTYQWASPTYTVSWSASVPAEQEVLAHFKQTGRIDFSILLDDVVKKEWFESKIRGVEVQFEGGVYNAAFNPVFQHWGRSRQRRRLVAGQPVKDVDQELMPIFELVPVQAPLGNNGMASGMIDGAKPGPANEPIPLNWWGRGLAANYSLAIPDYKVPNEGPNINLDGLTKLTVHFKVDSFATGLAAAQVQNVSLPAMAMLPGGTTFGLLELSAPAPAGGAIVKFSSSNPAVTVPQVKVAAGERLVKFPINVAANAAGQKAVITASTSATTRTLNVTIPNQKVRVLELVRAGAHAGQNVVVRGLAADDRFVYATYFLAPVDNVTPPAEFGFLAVIDAATWTVKHRVPVGDQPVRVAFHNNAQRRRLFVLNRGAKSYNLSVIDLTVDGKSFKSLTPVQLHWGLMDVAVHQATNRVYVTRSAGALYVIDALATDPAKFLVETIATAPGLFSMSIDQAANRIYVVRSVQDPNAFVERIERFDPVQRSFTPLNPPVLPARSIPADLAFDPDGRLYISNLGNTPTGSVAPNVTVVDLFADEVTPVQTTSGSWAVAVDAERNQAYVSTRSGLELIARSNHGGAPYRVISHFAMGPSSQSVALHPMTGEIYVGDSMDGSVRAAPPVDANAVIEWS